MPAELVLQALHLAGEPLDLFVRGVLFAVATLGSKPAKGPPARAWRHSTIWEEYKPSRRNNTPLAPGWSRRSYSSKMASL